LALSALALRDEGANVSAVAFANGFGSVDGYQRAFFREFGRNPGEYARRPVPIPLFTPFDAFDPSELEREVSMENVKCVYVQPVEKPARKVLIKRGVKAEEYFDYCEEVGCDVWGLLLSIESLSGEPVAMWLPPRYILPGTSRYVQGAEVPADYDGPVPEGLDVIELPAATYLMFRGEPFAEEDYQSAIGQVWQAIDKYDPSLTGYAWDDANPRIQLAPVGSRGYIELMPAVKA